MSDYKSVSARLQGWRGVGLLLIAVFCLSRGIIYTPGVLPVVPEAINNVFNGNFIGLSFWHALWYVAAGLCMFGAFFHKDRFSWIAAEFMIFIWCFAYLTDFISQELLGTYSNSWTSAVTMAVLGGLVLICQAWLPRYWRTPVAKP